MGNREEIQEILEDSRNKLMNSVKAGKMDYKDTKTEIEDLLADIRDCERIIQSQERWIRDNEKRLRELGYILPDKLKTQVIEKLREGTNIPRYTVVKQVSAENLKYIDFVDVEELAVKEMYQRLAIYLQNTDKQVKRTELEDGSVQLKLEYIIMTPENLVDVITEIMR
jgi:DNA gyrase/topoisomerase IV subunit A